MKTNLNRLGSHVLVFGSLFFLSACNNSAPKEESSLVNDTSFKAGPTTLVNDTSFQAMDHKVLITYLPEKVVGYKTIGYPDINDKYDGQATGETRSPVANPKYGSFAKQQYEKGKSRAEIALIDFLPGRNEFEGFRRLYLSTSMITKIQEMRRVDLALPATEAAFNLFPEENKGELRLFVCNRFLISIQVVDSKDAETELKKIAAAIRVSDLVKDQCKEQASK